MNFMVLMLFAGMVLFAPPVGLAMGQAPMASQGSLMGKAMYDVTLPAALGAQQSLSGARNGKKAILFFWATWCPHCHDELMRMDKLLDGITAEGIKIVLISEGETKADVAAYLKNNNVRLDSLLDEDNVLQDPYQLIGVPTLVFVDEQGIIRDVRHSLPDNYEGSFGSPVR